MADTGPTTLSLFSGVGGLDIGWELATGARVVGYCERDAYAASIGKGAGIDGERSGLWSRAFVPAIRELRPRYVFL